jgi:hypothetical protein
VTVGTGAAEPSSQHRPKRIPGKRFAIAFAVLLVGGTAVFTYLARQAQRSREAAFEQMQRDGVIRHE